MHWYKIVCKECHQGAGNRQTQELYAFSPDVIGAIKKYRHTGGVPHNRIPEIRPLNEEESSFLEGKLIEAGRNLGKTKSKRSALKIDLQ
ncbi:MAG: hypothetical protein AABW51_02115 [Nanoarchaeota archaeon]